MIIETAEVRVSWITPLLKWRILAETWQGSRGQLWPYFQHLLVTLHKYQLNIVTTQLPWYYCDLICCDPPPVIMSEENSCCGFKRKTVCMSLIGEKLYNVQIPMKHCFRALLPDLGCLDCDNNSISSDWPQWRKRIEHHQYHCVCSLPSKCKPCYWWS